MIRLREQDYPGTKVIQDWPSWNLSVLRWTKEQDAIVGYAHCGQGMSITSDDRLLNYGIPRFDGPGAHEAIVDVTHGLVDFLSGCDGKGLPSFATETSQPGADIRKLEVDLSSQEF